MTKTIDIKRQTDRFFKGFSELLPDYFRLHNRLLQLANPETHEIICSLNEIAFANNYNGYDNRITFMYLIGLEAMKFLTFNHPHTFSLDEVVKIKILVWF